MVSHDSLKKMCLAPELGKAYYRPFICKGELSKVDIFFVGINPATPIFPMDMEIDKYVDLLLNYEEFMDFYKASRLSQDKDEVSRTRIGMNSFFSWLSNYTDASILETDAIPYPTANLKALKKEPKFVIEKGKDIFYSLVTEFKPSLIILHGKKTVDQSVDIFISRGLIAPNTINVEQSIVGMELQAPLIQFKYSNGKAGVIMACRHFLYYGSKGDSFEPFRRKVLEILKRDLFHLLK
ncbi:hypothetical protein [Desulfosporosinus sp. BICA1-9]|uniref:hypothetical protein n=1 Tax=Desulfosporosinus sp. BICA1-9 TaxID=1531958 RepID=UPI00054C1C5D|nr:hypothetical protein [Desulfosporosinus sp. BICA1-9]KJS50631.1 MAG: hypothetical protein VR66_01605 [Peptococcaceae bacterium BRH_c23]KJS88825.1 MAG: hypothetical protein JL57_10380 [Desulfosporosinus sp. BICA1-9]HBW37722.1 hypothetical protein [Desulfosporosinus sp.]